MIIIQMDAQQLAEIMTAACRKVISEHTSFKSPSEVNKDTWFNVEQLQSYHPDKPTKSTIYSLVHYGKIPYHKNGKKLIFSKNEIDSWIKQGRKYTIAEIQDNALKTIGHN